MKKLYLLYLLASFTTVISKEVTGVFNQFNSLIWSYTYRARYEEISTLTAKAQLEWALDGTIASPGDTFTLVMPCVYKFMTYETSVQLTANSIAYATCDFDAGEDTKSFSSLKCTVTDELTEDTSVFGSVILPIAFNVGGSGSKSTITDSKCFSSGYNTVTFFDGNNQLSTTANFLPRRELAFGLVVSQRLSMSLDTMTNFVMSTPCFMGYQSGKLGFTSNDDDFEIDCSSIHVGITNEINDWSMPVSSVPFDHTIRCTSRALYIEFKTIPAGYRPFVDAIVQIPTTEPFFVKYTNEFACVNGIYTSIPFTSFFSQPILYDEALAIGADLVRTTSTVIGSITRTTTLPFISRLQKTKTILVLEPIPTTTVTTSHHGFDTWYYTKKATIGDTATVFIDVPQHTATTLTTYWQESSTATTTYFDDIDLVDTVIVKIPYPNPTIITTQFWSGKYLTTETHKEPPLGTDSVIIKEPHNPTVTTTEFWSESFATTETVTNGPEGTDSVIIKEPHNPTVTTTKFWSESFATTETITNGPEGTDSVIIKEPHNPTVTTTKFWSESFATTETITTGPLGTDSIVIHDPLEESSSSTAIESSDSNISSSAQDSSSSVEQSFTSADETSSIVELSSSSDIPSSSIGLTSSESSTVSSYDSYSSSTSESSIASSYDSYSSSSIESSTLSSSDRYSSSISDTTSFWDSSSSDLESTSITWSSSIDAQSSHLVQSVSNSISTSQEISSSSSEESSTSATDALVSSDASSILSSDTSSYYPSSTISPSDDFPHTIAGESDSQSFSFITSTVEISSDSVSLTSDPASSFDSSSRLNSDSSSSPSTDQRDILTSSSFSTLIKSSESRESSIGTILSEESSDSIPTTFSTRYWSPSGMSSRHYTNSTETSVSDVVSSSVAGDETSESSVSVISESSESVTSESVASESVTSESVASESVTSESVTSESVTSESVASESVTSESVASESVTAVSDISDLYTTSEVVSTSDSKIVPSTSVPSSEQRSSIPIMSSSDESSESRESSSGTILSEENSDSIPTTFSTRYVSVSLTVGELSALPSLPGKLSHLPSSLSETSIGMTKSANLSPQFFSTSVDSALSYWASGSSSADHQSSATCDVSESSVEGNLSAMALGMSNSDDGLSEDTRSSSVAGKEEIELTSTNSVGEITLISYSSSSPTTHDHGRVSKSMGAAPLSSLFSVSVHAPLVTGLSDSDTFPSENSNRSRSFKESTDNTISISRESLGNPYSSISSPSDYDVKSFTTSRELVSSESILPFSDVMDANDMPTSGSNLHSMVFSISVLGEKFNANIEKHKNTNGHYSSMVFTYQSAGLEESDQRIAVTNTKFDQNKIDTTIDSNTFVTSLPFATTSNDQIDQAVPIKIPASSTAGFVSDVLKPDYSKSVQAESVQTDSTTYSEMMSSKRNKNSGFGTSSLNLKPTITVVTKSIDTKVNTMKEGGVSKQVSTTVTEQYDTSTYTPASLLVSDNSGSVSKYSLWMMAFYMLFGLF
ncbi:ALS7 [Candida albicans]